MELRIFPVVAGRNGHTRSMIHSTGTREGSLNLELRSGFIVRSRPSIILLFNYMAFLKAATFKRFLLIKLQSIVYQVHEAGKYMYVCMYMI